jgi:hypothetical protein
MNFDIHAKPTEHPELVGIEIAPPISDKAFEGISKVLSDERLGLNAPDRTLVELTRSDRDGTAFVVERPQAADYSIEELAQRIGNLVDPTGRGRLRFLYPASE